MSRLLAVLCVVLAAGVLPACTDERPSRLPLPRTGGDGGRIDGSGGQSDAGPLDPVDGSTDPQDGDIEQRDALVFLDAAEGRDTGMADRGFVDGGACVYTSAVIGRVCAPEQREWVAGALVTLEAVDCFGRTLTLTATSGPDGSFRLDGVPPGTWTVTAQAGAFSQTYSVTVRPGEEEFIPNDALCVQQDVIRVAVVTGFGDRIEELLRNVGIQFDVFDGNQNWATSAAPFLSDLQQLRRYDLVFIDCAAATRMYTVDLGAGAATIIDNLRQYVNGGGSLYASDWAVSFLAQAFPATVRPKLRGTTMVSNPFEATELSGYAPQTITARVVDPSLAMAIGANTVPITFPDAVGARSGNWGLLDLSSTSATVLVEGEALTCSQGATICNGQTTPGPTVTAPLAIRFKLTPSTQRGGNVFYTAFHNIAQTGSGVADILRWIVFHL